MLKFSILRLTITYLPIYSTICHNAEVIMSAFKQIGFIGIGVMGKIMAGHLMKQGYEVHIFTRTEEKAKQLIEEGAIWHSSIASLAEVCQVIFTIVGYPHDVEEVYLSDNGIIAHAKPQTYIVDMTTSSPELATSIYEKASLKNLYALDAPVTGGDIGARNASLSIMVGGDEVHFEAIKPLLLIMGNKAIWHGPAGSGQHAKLTNQVAIAGTMLSIVEAITYAKAAGLDVQRVLESISSGGAASFSMTNLAPRILKEDFTPGFYVKHYLKDLRLALTFSKQANVKLPGTELVEQLYTKLEQLQYSDSGTQVLYELYRRHLV